jgi:hypothetical protein
MNQPAIPDDLFEGTYRPWAQRLLAHCMVVKLDPPAAAFVQAVKLYAQFDRAARTLLVFDVPNRIQRDAVLCSAALRLAELAQRPPTAPPVPDKR